MSLRIVALSKAFTKNRISSLINHQIIMGHTNKGQSSTSAHPGNSSSSPPSSPRRSSSTLAPAASPFPPSASEPAGATSATPPQTQRKLPALPAPPSKDNDTIAPTPRTLHVNGPSMILDHLGPMVIGRDGAVGRISNWSSLTEAERQNTLRVLGKRNQLRLAALRGDAESNSDSKQE